jgi:endonuclease-3
VTPQNRQQIFERFRAANPHPLSELEYGSPFELLVAVILSAQATDKSVNQATHTLFSVANTPEAFLALGVDGLTPYIRTIGLFNSKAKHIIGACKKLVEEFNGSVPDSRAALMSLDGVGRKTANVILNVAFGQPTLAVDTHVFRVANRTGLGPGKTPEAVEAALLEHTPAEFMDHAHHWLILHGRYTCKARKPLCKQCLIADLCDYESKTPA